MATTYTYSLASDFGGSIGQRQFHEEIVAEVSITPTLEGVTITDDVIDVIFESSLSTGEETTLDNLVSAHVKNTDIIAINHFSLIPFIREISSSSYQEIASYIYPGTNVDMIGYIKILSKIDSSGTSYDVRIRDITNEVTICETNFTNNTLSINDMGTLSNLPSQEAKIEFQVLRNGGNKNTLVKIDSISIYFSK